MTVAEDDGFPGFRRGSVTTPSGSHGVIAMLPEG
jgi:hypothetical protein